MNDAIHAFTDASVKALMSPYCQVWCSIIFVDGDSVVGRRIQMPEIIDGVGVGLSSSSGEQWAVIQAVMLADLSKPLKIFCDVPPMVATKKASISLLTALYNKAVQARVMPVERFLLPTEERNRGFHKWAHQLARGDIQARKIEGRNIHKARRKMFEREVRRADLKRAEEEMMAAIAFRAAPPTELEKAITGWSTPGVGHAYY